MREKKEGRLSDLPERLTTLMTKGQAWRVGGVGGEVDVRRIVATWLSRGKVLPGRKLCSTLVLKRHMV
jgi:hypothetical protein